MKRFGVFSLALIAVVCIAAVSQKTEAQISFGINIGGEPACPYGYYNYAPYRCAPFGYYGPQWFNDGLFIGAGPWFHGPDHFHGYVDRRFDRRYGYRGPMPRRGERPDWDRHHDWEHNFRGTDARNEYRHGDGRDHGQRHDNGYDQGRDHGHDDRH